MPKTLFSEALRGHLAIADISQREFAARVGISQSAVSHYLSDRAAPPIDQLERWALALGIDTRTAEYAQFLHLAAIAHLPEEVRDRFEAMQNDVESSMVRESTSDYGDDIVLPVIGRAAASTGAHVDGETLQPDPILLRRRWRAHLIAGDSGRPVVFPGQTVITDPSLRPTTNRIVVIPSRDGPILKRWGHVEKDGVTVANLDGRDPRTVMLADIGSPEVVVGVIFTDSVAK